MQNAFWIIEHLDNQGSNIVVQLMDTGDVVILHT